MMRAIIIQICVIFQAYANDVAEKTLEVEEEKQRTEALLFQMLPE